MERVFAQEDCHNKDLKTSYEKIPEKECTDSVSMTCAMCSLMNTHPREHSIQRIGKHNSINGGQSESKQRLEEWRRQDSPKLTSQWRKRFSWQTSSLDSGAQEQEIESNSKLRTDTSKVCYKEE